MASKDNNNPLERASSTERPYFKVKKRHHHNGITRERAKRLPAPGKAR